MAGICLLLLAAGAGCGGDDSGAAAPATANHEESSLCDDGDDNDGDGFTDCEDLDCRAESDHCPFAPPLDRTVPTNIVMAKEFLFTGDDPVQKGLDRDELEMHRFAVVRGRVTDTEGEPLRDVRVSIKDHPEFGHTLTRFDGKYDLVVNGGGNLIVQYRSEGYLTVERVATTNWLDYEIMPEVGMVERSTRKTRVVPSFTASAESEPIEDEYGARQPFVVFQPRTRAQAVLGGSETEELAGFELNITEYPYELPQLRRPGQSKRFTPGSRLDDNSLHYSLDFTVAEADALGAERVEFSKPVAVYVENFLGMPVGLPVRTEYYNRSTSRWQTEHTGRVVEIVSIDEGSAELDIDGDGEPDSRAALERLGFFEEELVALAQRYEVGQTLWRTMVSHFSAFMLAWTQRLAPGVTLPNELPKVLRQTVEEPTSRGPVRVENLAVQESTEVIGTVYSLVYQTDRTLGYGAAFEFELPLLGSSIPSTLRKIFVVVEVAGEVIDRTTYSAPFPKEHVVTWDGKLPVALGDEQVAEADRRLLQGQQKTKIFIGYGFDAELELDDGVAEAIAGPVNELGDEPLPETVIWRKHTTWLGVFDARGLQFGGFGLDVHHSYDSVNEILYYGYGDQRVADNALLLAQSLSQSDAEVFSPIEYPDSIAVGPDGTLFITDDAPEPKVWRVPPDGPHEIILGAGAEGQAGEVELASPQGIAIDSQDEGLFLVDYELKKLLKLHADGRVETRVGPVGSGATIEHDLEGPDGVTVAPDGSVFLADYSTVFRVEDAALVPFAGHAENEEDRILGVESDAPEIFPAENIAFDEASGVVVDELGTLFVSSRRTHLVYAIDADGNARVFAGTGEAGFSGDGGPAREAELEGPRGIALGRFDASVYIADQENLRIRRVLPGDDASIMTMAGGGEQDPAIIAPATDSYLNRPDGLAFAPDGTLYVGAAGEDIDHPSRLIKVFNGTPFGFSRDEFLIPNNDGSLVFRFDQEGRHLETIDAITEVTQLTFRYDTSGLLDSCTDVNGLTTQVNRGSDGQVERLISPFSFETRLRYDDAGALEFIRNDIRGIEFGYDDENGLMRVATEGAGSDDARLRKYAFDAKGRVKSVEGPNGDTETYIPRIDAVTHAVAVEAPSGTRELYELDRGSGSVDQARFFTDGDELSLGAVDRSGFVDYTLPGGKQIEAIIAPKRLWGEQARDLQEFILTTPSGREFNRFHGEQFNFPGSDPNVNLDAFESEKDPFAFTSYDRFIMLNNGPAWVESYDRSTRTWTERTPSGRTTTTKLDTRGRPTTISAPGLATTRYSYDAFGRIESIRLSDGEETRTRAFAYGDNGMIRQVEQPIDDDRTDIVGFGYAEDGFRQNSMIRQDGRALTWRLDRNDNVLGITPVGRPEHIFIHENGSRLKEYHPAISMTPELELEDPDWFTTVLGGGQNGFDLGETRYEYDDDNRLEAIRFSDGRQLTMHYSPGGRVRRVDYSRGQLTFDYAGDFVHLRSIGNADATVTFTYDDPLITSMSWSGQVSGSVSFDYDEFFRLHSVQVNGREPIAYEYDEDFQLTGAGDELITRDADSGLISGTSLGSISTIHERNAFGELTESFALHDATVLLGQVIERDRLGRITKITETKPSDEALGEPQTIEYSYEYDELGRLQTATIGGSTTRYDYDANGNRMSEVRDGVEILGHADFQDRMERYGGLRYEHSESGDLVVRTNDALGSSLEFEYDELGALLRVTKNQTGVDTEVISYATDGQGRRIARRLDGMVTHRWLYQDKLNPVAEIAPDGSVTQFVYGTRPHVPDYMIQGSTSYRIISDHLGSVRAVVDTLTGAVVQAIDYDAYGNILQDTNPGFQPFGFAGGLYDPDTGMVRFGARDYDPEVGRWLNRDPLLFNGGQANFYVYVHNDPVNQIDPSGLIPWIEVALPYLAAADLANWIGGVGVVVNILTPGATTDFDWNGGDPVVVLEDSVWAFGNAGMTWGHVVALKRDRIVAASTYDHELAHVKQHNVLGPAYLPLHILSQGFSLITTGTYNGNNPLEKGPHMSPPQPWWW